MKSQTARWISTFGFTFFSLLFTKGMLPIYFFFLTVESITYLQKAFKIRTTWICLIIRTLLLKQIIKLISKTKSVSEWTFVQFHLSTKSKVQFIQIPEMSYHPISWIWGMMIRSNGSPCICTTKSIKVHPVKKVWGRLIDHKNALSWYQNHSTKIYSLLPSRWVQSQY